MSFDVGHTTFGFTMRVPDADVAAVDDLISSHAAWMKETHSLTGEDGKLHTLEYYVSKAAELNDMMDPSKGTTGNVIYTVSEVHKDDEHFGKHVELGQSWDRINEFFGLFEKYTGAILGTAYEVAAPVTILLLVLIYRQIQMRRDRQVVR